MSKTFEHRLSDLIHEIKEIKKQIILDKLVKVNAAQTKIDKWKCSVTKFHLTGMVFLQPMKSLNNERRRSEKIDIR